MGLDGEPRRVITTKRSSLERRQAHKAAVLSLSHKGLSKISYQEEVFFKRSSFLQRKAASVWHFQLSWSCGAVSDHVLCPPRQLPLWEAGPSYLANTEPQVSPNPQDRGITQSQTLSGEFVSESNIEISCLFDVGTLRIPIPLVSLLHSVIFHLHENQTLTHLHYSACPTTLSCPGHLSLTQASWWDTGEKSLVRWKNHTLPSYALCLQSNSSEVTELLQMNRNEAKNPAFPACLPLM